MFWLFYCMLIVARNCFRLVSILQCMHEDIHEAKLFVWPGPVGPV